MKKMKLSSNSGMTLLEILMVLALLSVVITLLARNILPQFSKGKRDAVKIQMQQLAGDLDRYRLDCNRYPMTAQGLDALIQAPSSAPECPAYDPAGYLSAKKKKIVDVWNNPYQYSCEDGLNYEIISLGADGAEGGEGESADISSKDI